MRGKRCVRLLLHLAWRAPFASSTPLLLPWAGHHLISGAPLWLSSPLQRISLYALNVLLMQHQHGGPLSELSGGCWERVAKACDSAILHALWRSCAVQAQAVRATPESEWLGVFRVATSRSTRAVSLDRLHCVRASASRAPRTASSPHNRIGKQRCRSTASGCGAATSRT